MSSSTFKKIIGLGIVLGVVVMVLAFGPWNQETITFTPPENIPEVKGTTQVKLAPVLSQKTLTNGIHVFQTFNNCAPVALSMGLSYYGVYVGQERLAADLRPVNNLYGRNDDKSTPPNELAEKGKEYGLTPYLRADGDIEILKKFIANDIPIVVRTLLHDYEDYAHYRVVKGYDETTNEIIQDDGFEGKNLRISYDKWMKLWQPFNYTYLVFATPEQEKIVEAIIAEELDERVAWQNALATAQRELVRNPSDVNAQFNLSTANYYLGNYEQAVVEFEKIEKRIGVHTIWYQIEPIESYYKLGNYARVFSLSDRILNNRNPAFTELYILKGKSYQDQGKIAEARVEFQKAVFYNKNSQAAKDALASLGAY
jgi:hypothetical protein